MLDRSIAQADLLPRWASGIIRKTDLEPAGSDGDFSANRGVDVTNELLKIVMRMSRRALSTAAVATVLATQGLALGQISGEGVRLDNIESLESARPILEYIIAGVCIFGALAIGFKSSNRAQGT